MKQVEVIDAEVEKANKVQSAQQGNPIEIAALANVQNKIKKFLIEQQCEKKQEEAEQLKAKEETLSSLKGSLSKDDKSNTLKYVAYGVGGLVILIAVIMLIRKK